MTSLAGCPVQISGGAGSTDRVSPHSIDRGALLAALGRAAEKRAAIISSPTAVTVEPLHVAADTGQV
jgi:hypothetical protein